MYEILERGYLDNVTLGRINCVNEEASLISGPLHLPIGTTILTGIYRYIVHAISGWHRTFFQMVITIKSYLVSMVACLLRVLPGIV